MWNRPEFCPPLLLFSFPNVLCCMDPFFCSILLNLVVWSPCIDGWVSPPPHSPFCFRVNLPPSDRFYPGFLLSLSPRRRLVCCTACEGPPSETSFLASSSPVPPCRLNCSQFVRHFFFWTLLLLSARSCRCLFCCVSILDLAWLPPLDDPPAGDRKPLWWSAVEKCLPPFPNTVRIRDLAFFFYDPLTWRMVPCQKISGPLRRELDPAETRPFLRVCRLRFFPPPILCAPPFFGMPKSSLY